MSEPHVGMMVTPSVKLVRQLGQGGMGSVWVAYHTSLRTEVVVKFIAEGLRGSKDAIERFSREAAAAAQVRSPHVVQTFDHGVTADGVPYIVMEYLEGRDLGAYLDDVERASPAFVAEVVAQLARALERAHERGIVHRDIKPGNIFINESSSGEFFVKLLDFGIAKGVDMPVLDSGTKTGAVIGSPYYMSPEQILGTKGIDRRSDIWSVGVVVYEALTGEKPFDAETMGGLAIRIHSGALPNPSTVVPTLPPAIDAWFARACARDVDRRFASAKEMADALAGAVTGRPVTAVRVDQASIARTSSRPPRLATGATTEAGVSTATRQGRAKSRLAVIVVTSVLAGFGAFYVIRSTRSPGPSAAPSGAATSAPSATPSPGSSASAPAIPSSAPAVPSAAPAVPPPPPASAVVSGRPHPRPAPVHAVTSAPKPPPSSAPSSTVHDIF